MICFSVVEMTATRYKKQSTVVTLAAWQARIMAATSPISIDARDPFGSSF